MATVNPIAHHRYTKFTYQQEKHLSDDEVSKLQTCAVEKKSLIMNKDPKLGLHLGQDADGSIIVKDMKLLSPFRNTRLQSGMTIFAINGVTDLGDAEKAEKMIEDADDTVSIICGKMYMGKLMHIDGSFTE